MHLSLSDIPPEKELVNISSVVRPLSKHFGIPSEGYTSPHIYQQLASNVITGIYLEQIPEYQTSQVLNALLFIPWNWP